MICTSIQNHNLEEIQQLLQGLEMAEIRLDLCPLDDDDIQELFSNSDVPLIATCRIADPGAERKLRVAVEAGAKYVDLEVEASPWIGRSIRQACRQWGSVLIRSFHDFKDTPPRESLLSMIEKCRSFGGEVVKIVTTARSKADVDTVLSLYDEVAPGTLTAFCMGEIGRESRLEALRLGAPFTYASLSDGEATAPGQWTAAEMSEAVYGASGPAGPSAGAPAGPFAGAPAGQAPFRFIRPDGVLRMPSSKSFAQRAILASALADGVSHLSGYSPCGDNESAIGLAKALGADVKVSGDLLEIRGIGAEAGAVPLDSLSVGESGLLARLSIPLASALSPSPVRIDGIGTLLRRPLSDAHDIMASFGVRLYPAGSAQDAPKVLPSSQDSPSAPIRPSAPSRPGDCTVPLSVAGPLIPGRADVSGRGGSQLLSGLLYALPLAQDRSTLYVHDPRSIPYLFITVDVLERFGIRISSEMEGDEDFLETQDWNLCTGINFKIKGGQKFTAADFAIEADWSGAAPFLVAGAIFGEVELEGLDTRSLQADISILDILTEAGASLSQVEDSGTLHVQRAPLSPFDVDLSNCPDLFPIVAVLAAFCPGTSHISGVDRLKHKETDRAAAVEELLLGMGVDATIDGDTMTVEGMALTQRILTGQLLRGGTFTSHGDHRMAMALRVASLGASAPVIIDDISCVAKSFPGFNELFDRL